MIAREWHARATPHGARAYARHYRSHVVPNLRRIPGFRRAALGQRTVHDEVELVVVSIWDSFQAIEEFAGRNVEAAVVAAEAQRVLSGYDQTVIHWELTAMDGGTLPLEREG